MKFRWQQNKDPQKGEEAGKDSLTNHEVVANRHLVLLTHPCLLPAGFE